MFSNEFFRQRSLEVVWAVFRVAGRAKREKMRDILEERALDFFRSKNLETLLSLNDSVKLGTEIGEIGRVNGNVLSREMSRLRGIIEEGDFAALRMNEEEAKSAQEGEINIEEMFSRQTILLPDVIGKICGKLAGLGERGGNKERQETGDKQQEIRDEGQETGNKKQGTSGELGVGKRGEGENGKKPEEMGLPEENTNAPVIGEGGTSPREILQRFGGYGITFEKRREIIMDTLKKKPVCRMGDLALALPKVSPRTLRYDLKRLISEGIIERVGSGGPSLFLRLKKRVETL